MHGIHLIKSKSDNAPVLRNKIIVVNNDVATRLSNKSSKQITLILCVYDVSWLNLRHYHQITELFCLGRSLYFLLRLEDFFYCDLHVLNKEFFKCILLWNLKRFALVLYFDSLKFCRLEFFMVGIFRCDDRIFVEFGFCRF